MPDLAIRIEGREVRGWESATIRRSLDELAPSFSLDVRSPRAGAPEWDLFRPGSAAEIVVDGIVVISGWVEVVDDADHRMTVAGRARTGDLVDSAAIGEGGARTSWRRATALQIARDLCRPFAIAVSSTVALSPVPHFRTQPGEPVFEALDRLARDHAVRLVTTPAGDLELARTGARRSGGSIRYGVNVHSYQVTRSGAERFSRYIYRAQLAASDELSGDAAASVSYAVDDPGVDRYRPTVVQDDAQGGPAALQRRATWERNVRAGKATTLRYAVRPLAGSIEAWYAAQGELWDINTLVDVEDAEHGVSGAWLIRSVELRLAGGSPTVAALELVAPGAYEIQATPPKRARGKAIVW